MEFVEEITPQACKCLTQRLVMKMVIFSTIITNITISLDITCIFTNVLEVSIEDK